MEEAGESWLKAAAANGLERSTIKNYREELGYHITPFIGRLKLSEVSPQVVRRLEDTLREQGRSAAMVRRVIGSVGALLADAQEQGLTAHNAVRLRRSRHRGKERNAERRQKGKLKIGVDIPAPDEIRPSLIMPRGVGGRFLSRQSLLDFVHQSCVGYVGKMWISTPMKPPASRSLQANWATQVSCRGAGGSLW